MTFGLADSESSAAHTIDELLLPKMPEILDVDQKGHKVRNLLQAMRKDGLIRREGAKATAVWRLGSENELGA